MTAKKAETTRTRKTPEERATEALAVAERKVATLEKKKAAASAAAQAVEEELAPARARLNFLKMDPALPDTLRVAPDERDPGEVLPDDADDRG